MFCCSGQIEANMLFVGLDASGKSTLLYRLATGEQINTLPHMGFNYEDIIRNGVLFHVWDVCGSIEQRL